MPYEVKLPEARQGRRHRARRALGRWDSRPLQGFLLLLLTAVLVAAMAAPANAATSNVRHGCSIVGAAAGGVEAINCADIYYEDFAEPIFNPTGSAWIGGQATCRRTSDFGLVECSGVSQVIELWNYTKSKRVWVSPTFACGYYASYTPRCSPGRNYFEDKYARIIGCDQAFVIVRTTVRLPGTNTVRNWTASTSNWTNPSSC